MAVGRWRCLTGYKQLTHFFSNLFRLLPELVIENNCLAAARSSVEESAFNYRSAQHFFKAYQIAKSSSKPKGKAAYAEPMDWSGLLYCYEHDEPRRLNALNQEQRWACRPLIPPGSTCLQIADHMLTPPLTKAFLDCLDLTPHAEAVLEKLKSGANQNGLEESQKRKEETQHKTRLANLERYLGTSDDPEREAAYWRLIDEEKRQIELLRRKPSIPTTTSVDMEKVAQFLENLDGEWEKYPSRLRNQLIKLLIDRVEVRHDANHIEATICWKVGLKQVVSIVRPLANFAKVRQWQEQEDKLLRVLWPSSSQEAIMAALPARTWPAIGQRAARIGIKRDWVRTAVQKPRLWTKEEENKLKELYSSEASVDDIAEKLGRSRETVKGKAHNLGFTRPRELRWRRREPVWEPITIKLFQGSSSPS